MGAKLCCCCGASEKDKEHLTDVILARQPVQSEQCRGNLLVFINPQSGTGYSLETFAHTVAPKLDKNMIRYEVVITNGPNHAKNILLTKTDLGKFNGILIQSGDGLVFEALNGILGREDAFRVFPTLPIGVVPTGSGNGLVCSLMAKYGEKLENKHILNRALEIATSANPKAESVALYKVETDTGTLASFLSIGWGLMADIDIDSEKWRRMGQYRFTVMGFIRSVALRKYHGKLTYRPYKPKNYEAKENMFNVYEKTMQERTDVLNSDFNRLSISGSESDECPVGSKDWTLHDDDSSEDDLVTIEDDFINIYAVTMSHIASDGPYAPSAKLEDNRIHLSYILMKDIGTRIDIVKFLLAIEDSSHLDMPFVKRVEVSSMKLENMDEGSYVVIDGEVVDTKTLKVSSTRNNTCIFSPAV